MCVVAMLMVVVPIIMVHTVVVLVVVVVAVVVVAWTNPRVFLTEPIPPSPRCLCHTPPRHRRDFGWPHHGLKGPKSVLL